jgi:hypothetical protein
MSNIIKGWRVALFGFFMSQSLFACTSPTDRSLHLIYVDADASMNERTLTVTNNDKIGTYGSSDLLACDNDNKWQWCSSLSTSSNCLSGYSSLRVNGGFNTSGESLNLTYSAYHHSLLLILLYGIRHLSTWRW